jgi:hypothetical protein
MVGVAVALGLGLIQVVFAERVAANFSKGSGAPSRSSVRWTQFIGGLFILLGLAGATIEITNNEAADDDETPWWVLLFMAGGGAGVVYRMLSRKADD